MNKSDYCQHLINDIKDDIENDSDIIALESLLTFLLDIDVKKSFDNWKYIIKKYDIKRLNKDIDFLPIIKVYPEKLFKKLGSEKFFLHMKEISNYKLELIYNCIFNTYDPDCFLYQSLEYYIKKNNKSEEQKLINNILDKSNFFSKLIYDKTELIKRIIILHIDNKNIPIDFLKKLIEEIDNKKERAILKTMLIDYLMF